RVGSLIVLNGGRLTAYCRRGLEPLCGIVSKGDGLCFLLPEREVAQLQLGFDLPRDLLRRSLARAYTFGFAFTFVINEDPPLTFMLFHFYCHTLCLLLL